MVNFLKIIAIIFLLASVVASVSYLSDYIAFYQSEKPFHPDSLKHPDYIFKTKQKTTVPEITLPDLSLYTIQNLKFNMPVVRSSEVTVQHLTRAVRDLSYDSGFYGDMQERLDPVSIVIERGLYDLETLTATIDDDTLIEKQEAGRFILHVPLAIRIAGGLIVQDGETLLMNGQTGALISNFGTLYMIGANVKGWHVDENKPATFNEHDTFRPYITAWCGAEMNIAESRLSHLGYEDTKAYGLTYTSCSDSIYADDTVDFPPVSGWVIDNEVIDLYQGLTAIGTDGLAVLRNNFRESINNGIGLHEGAKNTLIAYNEVIDTGEKHGILLEEGSAYNFIAYNRLKKNGENGLTIFESPHNVSYHNQLIANEKTGLRVRGSADIYSIEDTMSKNVQSGTHISARETTIQYVAPKWIGNKKSNIKAENFSSLVVSKHVLFKLPAHFFAGELNMFSKDFMETLLQTNEEFSFTRESDAPPFKN